jgi:acetyltransferase-like isoleucine patch superfamily enzyme
MIHHLADVASNQIGQGTKIWQFVVILKKAKIGSNCNICAHVFIENDVEIGNNVTIKSGVQIWDGLEIGNDVFIGPNATFTNDKHPRSKDYSKKILKIKDYASIGANATILPGITIRSYAMIGAGAVVTIDVDPHQIVAGNPAVPIGYITADGSRLNLDLKDKNGEQYKFQNGILHKE